MQSWSPVLMTMQQHGGRAKIVDVADRDGDDAASDKVRRDTDPHSPDTRERPAPSRS